MLRLGKSCKSTIDRIIISRARRKKACKKDFFGNFAIHFLGTGRFYVEINIIILSAGQNSGYKYVRVSGYVKEKGSKKLKTNALKIL